MCCCIRCLIFILKWFWQDKCCWPREESDFFCCRIFLCFPRFQRPKAQIQYASFELGFFAFLIIWLFASLSFPSCLMLCLIGWNCCSVDLAERSNRIPLKILIEDPNRVGCDDLKLPPLTPAQCPVVGLSLVNDNIQTQFLLIPVGGYHCESSLPGHAVCESSLLSCSNICHPSFSSLSCSFCGDLSLRCSLFSVVLNPAAFMSLSVVTTT